MTRPVLLSGAVAMASCAIVLGAIQFGSMAAYGDLATRRSLPAALHLRAGASPRVLGGARVRAAALVHVGDRDDAAALLATLPEDASSEDLRGRLAEQSGQTLEALDHYIRAGDGVRAQRLIGALVASGEPRFAHRRGMEYERRLADVLARDPEALDIAGNALLRLAQLERAVGDDDPAEKKPLYRESEDTYVRALQLAPNDATYLLGAANQALLNAATFGGDTAQAERWFHRVLELQWQSADGYAGLATEAAVKGDCAAAQRWLAGWRALPNARGRFPVTDPALRVRLRACVPQP